MSRHDETPRPEDFRFSCDIEVRFRDLDAMGHVNNATYLTYFEVARTGYARAIGHESPEMTKLEEIYPFILLDVGCRFLAPAGLGQRLRVYLRTPRVGSKSFRFEYLVTAADGTAVATGHTTQVFYDYAGAQTSAVPAAFRALLSDYEGIEL